MDKDEMTKKELSELWIEYYNDFLTIERFAEWHMVPKDEMVELLHEGKEAYKELTD